MYSLSCSRSKPASLDSIAKTKKCIPLRNLISKTSHKHFRYLLDQIFGMISMFILFISRSERPKWYSYVGQIPFILKCIPQLDSVSPSAYPGHYPITFEPKSRVKLPHYRVSLNRLDMGGGFVPHIKR